MPADDSIPAKQFTFINGSIVEHKYPKVLHWRFMENELDGIRSFAKVQSEIYSKNPVILIRGTPKPGTSTDNKVLRRQEFFFDNGSPLLCIDIDGVPIPKRYSPYELHTVDWLIKRHLPREFHNVTCAVSFSGSAGIIDPATGELVKPGLRVHLFFELNQPLYNYQVKAWLKACPVDLSLYTPVQPHYLADPVIGHGIECRVKQRHHLLEYESDTVLVPQGILDLSAPPAKAFARSNPKSPHDTTVTTWTDPTQGAPKPEHIMACNFMRWFVTEPSIGSGRYPVARAFATNAFRTAGDAESFVRDGLNSNRPVGYTHTEAVISSLAGSRPISCSIIADYFDCHQFNHLTGCCRRANHSYSPFGLGLQIMKGIR